ncbi:MAG: hypothetical protein M1356_07745, partial [Gammaproteobacteria bacterium]|nr:hypothetical protein [Gammaproteobacteria bacterium]
MSILGAIWRALLSLLLFFVTQVSWHQISSEREIAHAQIEKYQQLKADSVVRPITLNSEYFWRELSDGQIRYELQFTYRDAQSYSRTGVVPTYTLPENFADQPVYFLKTDNRIHALDLDLTIAEKTAEYEKKISDAKFNFGLMLLITLFCLAGMWMSLGRVPRTESDFLALDTEQTIKLRRSTARAGGHVLVTTPRGKLSL